MLTLTSPVETPLHHVPVGVKLSASLAIALATFALGDAIALAAVLASIALVYAMFGAAFFRAGLSALALVLPFIVVVGVWHLVTRDVQGGMIIILRLLIVMSVANLVTMTTPLLAMMAFVERAAGSLRHIGLSPKAVALAVALAVRFVSVFRLKVEMLASAWRARSHRRPRPVIVVPLLLCLFDDAEHVADALRARGGIEQ